MPDSAPSPVSAVGVPSRSGGDACPGTLRLHRADDGSLARVRIPGGVLDADRADALLTAAGRFGDGELHLTSRGNVQLRGLGAECGGELAGLLGGAGLLPSAAHERARNIVASPLAGLDGSPALRTWLTELDRLLCGSASAAALSGRFLFALDDGGGDVDALGADVTLIADGTRDAGGQDGPDGTLGSDRSDRSDRTLGADRSHSLPSDSLPSDSLPSDVLSPVALPPNALSSHALLRIGTDEDRLFRVPADEGPRAALLAAETFLRAARDTGAWRVKDLPDDVRKALRDEVGQAIGATRDTTAHRPLPRTAKSPEPGPVTGPGGRVNAIVVGVPLGRLTPAQWRLLTGTARLHGDELRLTPWRGVVVTGPFGPDGAAKALHTMAAAGLITGPDAPWTGVGACIGHPGCAKSLADVRAEAGAAVGPAGRLPVYWSGCERRCGHPHGEWIDVVVTADGHRISRVRGERRDPPVTIRNDPAALAAAVASARA